ncbi:MAG: TorF family putative porin [Pseudoxanthomonas sp.]
MKRRMLALACLASLGQPAAASAGEPHRAVQWNGGAILATDYVWRGQSLTAGKPSITAEIKMSHDSGAFAGIWAGNIDLGSQADANAEIDWFFGWAKKIGKTRINTGYLYRQRPSDTQSLDFQEITASVSYDFGIMRLGAGGYYSWDYFQGGHSTYGYANLGVPIAKPHGVQVLVLATAGRYDFSNRAIGDYANIDLRVVAKHGSREYSIGYSDTDIDRKRSGLLTRNQSGPRWRAQVLFAF